MIKKQQLNALWSKVFLRRVIEQHHLCFDTELDIDEDVNFIFSYVLNVERIRMSKEVLYNTTMENPESLTRRKRDYLCEQLQKAGLRRESMLEKSTLIPASRQKIRMALDWLYYRGAYSAATELFKYSLSKQERRARIKEICRTFNNRSNRPRGVRSMLVALPVRLYMSGLIDFAAQYAIRKRKL